MEAGADIKQESANEERKASSEVAPCSSTPSTVVKTEVTIMEQDNPLKRKPLPEVTEATASTAKVTTDAPSSTVEPENKRAKIENEETTTTAEIKDLATKGPISENGPSKAPLPTETTVSVTTTQKPLGINSAVSSPPASAVVDTSSSATAEICSTNKPLHAVAPTIKQEQVTQPTSLSVCPAESAKTTKSLPVKVEASSGSSSNSQGGPASIVTASVESSSQATSQSSSTSAVSSNDSLHDSETNRLTVASTPTGSSTKPLPSASIEVVQPAATAATVPTARPQNLKPPPPAMNQTTLPHNHPPQATTKVAATATNTTAIRSPSKPLPARTHIPSSAATTTAPAPVSKTSTNSEVPLKSLNFNHLRIKYLGELEYMLREFRKLERQLLGAKGAQQLEESVGSRERREKLHSFILHLEDTMRQIELGCKIEVEGRPISTNDTSTTTTAAPAGDATAAAEEAKKQLAQESALSNLTKEKEEEETVQKLEEHILANLLPVKVRLKKQLAAQQGATQNPPGMPARRGSMQPSSVARGKGTFVEAVEKKRKHAESLRLAAQVQHERLARREVSDPTQFGKPLSGVGSSLTKKLHGSTLGSKQRRTGHGVGSASASVEAGQRRILHAGMVPKSTQQESGLSAASGVHEIVKSSVPPNTQTNNNTETVALTASTSGKAQPVQTLQASTKSSSVAGKQKRIKMDSKSPGAATKIASDADKPDKTVAATSSAPMSEEERLKYKKHRRLRKLKRLKRRRERELARQQHGKTPQLPNNTQPASNAAAGRKKASHSKVGQKKKGPRVVEYLCSQCSEAYSSTCDLNPWWALAQHKCPKCGKTQIPRIDITSPANAIEYHPALLSHLEDGGRGAGSIASAQAVAPTMPIVSQVPDGTNSINSESDSDLSELSDDNISMGSLKAAELESELQSMTPAERAEHETFGKEYDGPVLAEEHAAKLLILMTHASTCPCHHKSEKHKEVCRATKYMMLHVRDCPGTTATCDVCPFPWCRKVKHLLYHLVSCEKPDQCAICSPKDLPKGLQGLVGLNAHRTKKHRERLIALAKASRAAKSAKANPATKKQSAAKRTAAATQGSTALKATSEAKAPIVQSAVPRSAPAPAPTPKPVATTKPAPHVPPTTSVAPVATGVSDSNPVSNPVIEHPAIPEPSIPEPSTEPTPGTDDIDLMINQEISKLGELGSDEVVPMEVEAPVSYAIPEVDAAPASFPTVETPNNQVLPTPVEAIQTDEHDADAQELSDLLATNSSEDHAPVQQDDDLGELSEFLKNQEDQHGVPIMEPQQPIDMSIGYDSNPDPLANMNQEIVIESSDYVPIGVPVALKEELPGSCTAPEGTPAVSAAKAEAPSVEPVGSVAVK